MEATANFMAGLRAAYDELDQEGTLTAKDRETAQRMFKGPVLRRSGKRVIATRILHQRVRRLYARTTGAILPFEIDWTKIVEWIKENWLTIVKIMLSLLMFVI